MSSAKDEKGHPADHDEKGGKGLEEKYRRDPFTAVLFGLILILAGVLWLLSSQNYITEWGYWFLIGLGSILIIERLARYTSPAYRRPMFGRVLIGLILICIGTALAYDMTTWWPLIVIIAGAGIIVYGITRTRRPKP